MLANGESLDDVLASFQVRQDTRYVDATLPQATDIKVDIDDLETAVKRAGYGDFRKRGLFLDRPANLLDDVDITFSDGAMDAAPTKPAELWGERRTKLLDDFEPTITLIDNMFRNWAQIDPGEQTAPILSILAGTFNGRSGEVNRHFDYRAQFPSVSFKLHFMGKPEHASVYYPGMYRVPSRFTEIARAFGGDSSPSYPKSMFRRKDAEEHIMPFAEVCAEPWHVFHSGPPSKDAWGLDRGILVATYRLDQPPVATNPETTAA